MKRLSYEPLIIHLFKIFTNALKSKNKRHKTENSEAFDGETYISPKNYDDQKKKQDK